MKLGINLDLSETMIKTLNIMDEHEKLVRYDGGFWSWENAELKPLYNGGNFLCMVPCWYCNVKTLRALKTRGLVFLDENEKVSTINPAILQGSEPH